VLNLLVLLTLRAELLMLLTSVQSIDEPCSITRRLLVPIVNHHSPHFLFLYFVSSFLALPGGGGMGGGGMGMPMPNMMATPQAQAAPAAAVSAPAPLAAPAMDLGGDPFASMGGMVRRLQMIFWFRLYDVYLCSLCCLLWDKIGCA
jgi:hypothetical protein